MKKPISFRERVRRFVVSHPGCTSKQVRAAVGRYVPRPQAMYLGRADAKSSAERTIREGHTPEPRTQDQIASRGIAIAVKNILWRLSQNGEIFTLARGVYGPPPPKLYSPAEAG